MEHFFLVSIITNLVLTAVVVALWRAKDRAETKVACKDERIRRLSKDRDEWRELVNFTEQELEKEQEAYNQLTVAYTLVLLNVNKRLDIIPPTVAALN